MFTQLWLERITMLYGEYTWASTRVHEARLDLNEIRMLRWMCGVTRRDDIQIEHISGTTIVTQTFKKITEKTTRVQLCGEDERRAHREKNARCGNTREQNKMAAKPNVESCV